MFINNKNYILFFLMGVFLAGCSRAETPILDIIHDKASAPYICWINGEPAVYVIPPYRGSWYGFPVGPKNNRLKFERKLMQGLDLSPPQVRLRYQGEQEGLDLKSRDDGIEFDAGRSEWPLHFSAIPGDFNADALSAYVKMLLAGLEAGKKDEVDRLFKANDGSSFFPRFIFTKSSNAPSEKKIDRRLSLLKGKYFILVIADVLGSGLIDNDSQYLFKIKVNTTEYAMESMLFYYNAKGEICLYVVDSAVFGKLPQPLVRLP